MTPVEQQFEAVRRAIYYFGRPICGEEPTELTVQTVSVIEVRPYRHLVDPVGVDDMVECSRELWYEELLEDFA